MGDIGLRAVFMRGGTSKALFFHERDLPGGTTARDRAAWTPLLLAAMGSPDPHGRQLNGMGGGISSLSKIAVIGPPSRPDADIDYTFGQVGIGDANIGYRGNCGNISAAVGPFAVDEDLVSTTRETAIIRIHNTNTGKIITATFPVEDGKAVTRGDFVLQGIAGTGAPVALAFLDPGGATTGALLPTGNVRDVLTLPGGLEVEVSLVDASNPVVFINSKSLGLTATESPDDLSADRVKLACFEDVRVAAAVAMGLVPNAQDARTRLLNLPLVAIVAAPRDSVLANGKVLAASDMDVLTRMVSAGQPHRATPLTGAMCLAVAAHIPGTVVQAVARPPGLTTRDLRLAHPSGILPIAATVSTANGKSTAEQVVVYRTARRLMEGRVFLTPH